MIKTEGLTKKYKNVLALDQLTLHIKDGDIFGFIGPNGAGKTTTIRILSGLLRATSGKATVSGIDVIRHPRGIMGIVGFMPADFGVYHEMRVWEYLDFFGAAFRIPKRKRRARIEEVLDLTRTTEMRDYYVDSLSTGMKQGVGIAKTLMHDPKVLFLDEPAAGLDPRARVEMRQLLKKLKDVGKTMLVSSHILPELATICDSIGIIEKARLLISGSMQDVLKRVRKNRVIEIEFRKRAHQAVAFLQTKYPKEKLRPVERSENLVRLEFDGLDAEIAGMLKILVDNAHPVLWFREVMTDLEEIFLTVTDETALGKRAAAEKGR